MKSLDDMFVKSVLYDNLKDFAIRNNVMKELENFAQTTYHIMNKKDLEDYINNVIDYELDEAVKEEFIFTTIKNNSLNDYYAVYFNEDNDSFVVDEYKIK